MDERRLRRLLARLRDGSTTVEQAVAALRGAPYEDVGGFATLDHHRTLRVGMPEVVLAERKTAAQVAAIARKLAARGPLLVTRLDPVDPDAGGLGEIPVQRFVGLVMPRRVEIENRFVGGAGDRRTQSQGECRHDRREGVKQEVAFHGGVFPGNR